jgi:release factor glutamine methyltransferase
VGHALGFSALELATREGEIVSGLLTSRVAEMMERRLIGESVARIIGEREFYGLAFTLNGATLEPRPETELLVDLAIEHLPMGGRLLDLGTGTGCIPVAVLANRADASAVATDLSAAALAAASGNAGRHGVGGRLELRQGDWFGALAPHPGPPHEGEGEDRTFDVIVSNPPYIASAVVDGLAPEVRDFDPRLALDGGADGLAPYRVIAAGAGGYLRPGGQVMVEIGYDQGAQVTALFGAAGFRTEVRQDLNGLDRVVCAHHL